MSIEDKKVVLRKLQQRMAALKDNLSTAQMHLLKLEDEDAHNVNT